MSRLRQVREQTAGRQNTSKTLSGYYGSSSKMSKKSKKMSKKRNPSGGY